MGDQSFSTSGQRTRERKNISPAQLLVSVQLLLDLLAEALLLAAVLGLGMGVVCVWVVDALLFHETCNFFKKKKGRDREPS